MATGSRDIYAAIEGAFDVQKVNIDNSIAEQHGAISKLPPVLQVQVQRVQFDAVKKRSFKSTYHLDLKETIYLDRYMDTQKPEILERRQQCWEWKKSLRKLEARRGELLRTTVCVLRSPRTQTQTNMFFSACRRQMVLICRHCLKTPKTCSTTLA